MSSNFKGTAQDAIFQRSLHIVGETGESPIANRYLRDNVDTWYLTDGELAFSFDDRRGAKELADIFANMSFGDLSHYLQLLIENFKDSAHMLRDAEFASLNWDVLVAAELDDPDSAGVILGKYSLNGDRIDKVPNYPPLNSRVKSQIEEILRRIR